MRILWNVSENCKNCNISQCEFCEMWRKIRKKDKNSQCEFCEMWTKITKNGKNSQCEFCELQGVRENIRKNSQFPPPQFWQYFGNFWEFTNFDPKLGPNFGMVVDGEISNRFLISRALRVGLVELYKLRCYIQRLLSLISEKTGKT